MDQVQRDEAKRIQDDCTYTAEAHHIIALRNHRIKIWLQMVPAIGAALLGTLSVGQVVPAWVGVVGVVSAVVTAITTVLNPSKTYYEHLSIAKSFTVLKHDAQSLRETFGMTMTSNDVLERLKALHDRYNDLVRIAPPTDNRAFAKAQKRINGQKVHEPD